MNNAPLDENGRQGLIVALNTDGKTITSLKADKTNHGLQVSDGSTGSNNGNHGGNALIDENGRQSMVVLASDGSGQRVILYADSSGNLLVQST